MYINYYYNHLCICNDVGGKMTKEFGKLMTYDEYKDDRQEEEYESVNHPKHYNQGKYETIDIIEDAVLGYEVDEIPSIANVIKYIIRAPFKGNKLQDLKKALWFLERVISKNEQL